MQTWIALLRGINVGGKNILPMAELRRDLESIGLNNVRTYIQSGNVVFESAVKSAALLAEKIARKVEAEQGFRPQIMVLGREELQAAMEANPFPEAADDPKTLHFFFLAEPATTADLTGLEATRAASEEYQLTDRVFYLHAPDGIGRSKLAAHAEKRLGVATTARNYRTVDRILSLATKS